MILHKNLKACNNYSLIIYPSVYFFFAIMCTDFNVYTNTGLASILCLHNKGKKRVTNLVCFFNTWVTKRARTHLLSHKHKHRLQTIFFLLFLVTPFCLPFRFLYTSLFLLLFFLFLVYKL